MANSKLRGPVRMNCGNYLRMAFDMSFVNAASASARPRSSLDIGRVEYAAVKAAPPILIALGPPGVVHPSTSFRTLPGCRSANCRAIIPPIETPTISAASKPTESISAAVSSASCAIV